MPSGEYVRYVALGDSQTEGVGDGDDTVGLRGWADRLAEQLAAVSPGLHYANLAVRGRVAGQVRAGQLGPALALRPDLATVVAGVNDVLRPRFDAAEVAGHLEEMFAELTAAGARVATMTFPDVGRIAPLARPVRGRVFELNDRIRAAAARHGVAVAEIDLHAAAADPRLWSTDRLHTSPSATSGSPPPSPRPSSCPEATTPGPAPCRSSRFPRVGRPRAPRCAGPPLSSAPGSDAVCAAGPRATAAPRNAPCSSP